MARARRRRGRGVAGQDNSDHPATCACRACMLELRITDHSQLELVDPDSMEDSELPYVWNRNPRS